MNKLKKIIEYGLYLLVFLLPIQTRWIVKAGEIGGAYSEYGTISLYGADILLFLLLVLLIVYKLRVTSCELRVTRIWWVIAGLELMVFVSIFVASDKVLALYRYGVFLSGVGLFWLVTSAGYNRVKLIYAFLAGILLQAVLGIWQFLTQSSFANKWLGLAFHDAGALGTSVIETVGADGVGDPSTWLGAGRWLRAYGGLDHPNVLGGLLVVGILTMAYLMLGRKQIANEFSIFNFQFSNNFQFSIFNFSIFIILIACLFFTFSRSAWLGLVVGLMVMLGTAVIRKDYWAQKKILEAVLAGAVMVFILFNIYGNLVSTRLSQTGRLEVKSTNERIESYKDAWGVIKSNWWLGAGIGNYAISDFGFRISDFKMENPANLQSKITNLKYLQPVHNTFLLIWAEIGILGLIFFILLLITILFNNSNISRFDNGKNNKYLKWAIISALLVMMTLDHFWWSLHFGVLLFWLIMGIIYGQSRGEEGGKLG